MNTKNQNINLELIRQAQQGRPDSESLLAELTRQKVFPYLYRLTFNYHLAQDMCQETLIQMHKSLTKLDFNSKQAFFAWIYRTALSKVRKHHRYQGNRRLHTVQQSTITDMEQRLSDPGPGQLEHMIQKELFQAAVAAMRTMKLSYRNILTLRCFDALSYDEIATVEGRSKLACRIMFCKAKRTLRKNLAQRGFDNSYLLPALTLIGTATLSETASAVTAAAPATVAVLSAGKGISLLSMIVSKASLLIALCLATGLVTTNYLGRPQKKIDSSWTVQRVSENVSSGTFTYPSRLIRYGIPPSMRLTSIDPTEPNPKETDIKMLDIPEYLNIDDPCYIKMFSNYWIECSFDGKSLIDGPGPDIFITINGCKYYSIILTDGGDRTYELASHNCTVNHTQEQTIPYDLEGHDIGFEPTAIRFNVNDADTCGMLLRSISARTKQ